MIFVNIDAGNSLLPGGTKLWNNGVNQHSRHATLRENGQDIDYRMGFETAHSNSQPHFEGRIN